MKDIGVTESNNVRKESAGKNRILFIYKASHNSLK